MGEFDDYEYLREDTIAKESKWLGEKALSKKMTRKPANIKILKNKKDEVRHNRCSLY